MAKNLPGLTLVGPGRAGRALARSWTASGGTVDAVLARSAESAADASRAIGAVRHGVTGEGPFESEVLAIAVPDDAIAPVAALLAPLARCRVAFHLSGALSSRSIAPLRRSGAAVASFHPLRPFRGESNENFRGAFAAVEGDAEACEAVEGFARRLGASPHRIAAEAKPLYHAGATLAAGGVVALLSAASRAWARAGLPEDDARAALAGLAREASEGASGHAFEIALTGPVARRDVETVRAHLRALGEASPDLLALYVLLASETLERTPGRGREDELRALLTC